MKKANPQDAGSLFLLKRTECPVMFVGLCLYLHKTVFVCECGEIGSVCLNAKNCSMKWTEK